jgi:hypothetical protein
MMKVINGGLLCFNCNGAYPTPASKTPDRLPNRILQVEKRESTVH